MKKKLIIFICFAVAAAFFLRPTETNAPDYSSFSVKPNGVSLFFDTLKHMGYPVQASRFPLDSRIYPNDVYIIVRPNNPYINREMAEDILGWVKRGGRLIFFDSEFPTVLDRVLSGQEFSEIGNLTHYYAGMGEVITGFSGDIINENLMHESGYGNLLENTLRSWNAERIWFAEYYHGYHTPDNFYTQLPAVVKLGLYQLIIFTAAFVLCVGKRFGKPIPYHEEAEREENGHVKALARLYRKAGG
jgi:hypothetical protein